MKEITMNARDALIELQGIRSDFEKNKVNYGLIESEIKDTKAVINTLEYILTALIENKPLKCCLSFYSDNETKIEVPIHFENYALKENVNEMMSEKSKQLLFGSLIIKFIECYHEMKKKNKMKAFCSRLEGNCIDARTRGAFDFVLTNQDPPPFTDLLRFNMQALPIDHKDLYFFAFAEILKNSWDKPFIADKQEKGLCKKKGVINTDQFELIKSSLEMLGFEPSNDFLMAYNMLNDGKHQHLLPIYMKFVLSHQNILDEIGLNKQGVEKEGKENNNTATPVVRSLYNKMVIDLIPIMSKTIQNNPKNYGLDAIEFKLFIDFLERTSPATCFSILSFVPIHDLHPERIKIYTNLLYQKLMWSKDQHVDEYKKFLKTKFGRKFDLHGLLEKFNPEKASTIRELMFEEEHKEATLPHQYEGEVQFRLAVDPQHFNVVLATQLIAEKK